MAEAAVAAVGDPSAKLDAPMRMQEVPAAASSLQITTDLRPAPGPNKSAQSTLLPTAPQWVHLDQMPCLHIMLHCLSLHTSHPYKQACSKNVSKQEFHGTTVSLCTSAVGLGFLMFA
jgi:hypothetical protein